MPNVAFVTSSMHYRLGKGVVVKTENAAKPQRQRSAYLSALLADLPPVETCFDYGCGKLRYSNAILKRVDRLAVVDSETQLSRTQKLGRASCSIRSLLQRSNAIEVYNDQEFRDLSIQFDRGFCINVLSVIPILARRRRVIETIRSRLKRGAGCLFVVQYRNSDFDRMRLMPNARPWLDGFLIDSLRGFSFYGLISPDRLAALVRRGGLVVKEVKLNEGSAYLWATHE